MANNMHDLSKYLKENKKVIQLFLFIKKYIIENFRYAFNLDKVAYYRPPLNIDNFLIHRERHTSILY